MSDSPTVFTWIRKARVRQLCIIAVYHNGTIRRQVHFKGSIDGCALENGDHCFVKGRLEEMLVDRLSLYSILSDTQAAASTQNHRLV